MTTKKKTAKIGRPKKKKKSKLVKEFEQFLFTPTQELHVLDLVLSRQAPRIIETFATYSVFEARR